jgi:hypothetical protein
MAGGGIAATRENLYYLGWGKESTWNTPIAPTNYWRWLDGTDANPERKVNKEREGDTGPFINLVYVSEQHWVVKVVEYVRPITVGCVLQALLGTGSDAYTAPTKSTTLAASIVAGATSFQSTADLGNTGTLALNFTPGYASAAYEVQTANLTTRSGAGPYTYSLAGSGKFTNAHANGDALTSAATHVFTRQQTTYDPYSIEAAFSQSGFGKAFRIQDCVCVALKITMETGKLVRLEHDWYGSLATIQAALQTPSFEGSSVIGQPGSPLHYFMAGSSWSVDGSTSGAAAVIKKLEISLKNSTTAEDFQTEGLSPTYFIPGNFDIDATMDVIFTTYQQYLETYFGSPTATTGATDNYIQGYGQASVTFTGDAVNSLALSLPNVAYTAAKLNPPKLDGKPLMQAVAFSAQKTAANPTPFTATLTNSQASVY